MRIETITRDHPSYNQMIELRRAVLRLPLGLDFTEEELESEAEDAFCCAIDEKGVIGCLVLTKNSDDLVRMRQVAVSPELRGLGIGRLLVNYSEVLASMRGYSTMTLHARSHVVSFYRRLGYDVHGGEFVEVGIPHFRMSKALPKTHVNHSTINQRVEGGTDGGSKVLAPEE